MTAQHLLTEFKALGGSYVSLSGGEPILYKEWRPVMRYARFLELQTILVTNGTLLRPRDLDFLTEIDSAVAVSLDGGSADTHDFLRGAGTFERTVATLRLMAERGMGKSTTLCFTPSAYNWKDLPTIVHLAHTMGIGTVYISLMETRGRAEGSIDELGIGRESVSALLFMILSLQERYGSVSIECLNLKYFTERLRGLPVTADGLDRTLRVTADSEAFLTAYLDASPFHLGRYVPGGLEALWYSDKTQEAFDTAEARPRSVAKCRSCFSLQWCHAGSAAFAWAAGGTFDAVDAFCEAKRKLVLELAGATR